MAEQDYVQSDYFTRPELGIRGARVLSGRGTVAPGYRLVGEGKSAPSESLQDVQIVKMVSPLTGQAPADMYRTARDYARNALTLDVRRVRMARSVAPNVGSKVVRPKITAVRILNNKGQGTVIYR